MMSNLEIILAVTTALGFIGCGILIREVSKMIKTHKLQIIELEDKLKATVKSQPKRRNYKNKK